MQLRCIDAILEVTYQSCLKSRIKSVVISFDKKKKISEDPVIIT